jgi:hypothetical protein
MLLWDLPAIRLSFPNSTFNPIYSARLITPSLYKCTMETKFMFSSYTLRCNYNNLCQILQSNGSAIIARYV